MDALLKKLSELSVSASPDLGKMVDDLTAIYKSAGVVSESVGSGVAAPSSYADFSKMSTELGKKSYKVADKYREQAKAIAEMASIFTFGSIPAGKERISFVDEQKDAVEMFLNKAVIAAESSDKEVVKAWKAAVMEVIAHVQAHVKGTPGSSSGQASAMSKSLFADINKGTGVTSGLKKVDDSEKTHKNPALRGTSVVPDAGKGKSGAKSTKASVYGCNITGDPKFEKVDQEFRASFLQSEEKEVAGSNRSKGFFSHCLETKFIITEKVNSIVLENCTGCLVHVKAGLISSIELIRCVKCHVQCDVLVPSVQMDNSVDCHIHIPEKELMKKSSSGEPCSDMKVLTSQCGSININHLDDEMYHKSENPVPFIFCSTFCQTSKKWMIKPQEV